MKEIFLVFVGGGIGSLFRYGISRFVNPLFENFPLATLCSNTISCLIMGVALSYTVTKNATLNFIPAFVLVGICGGFSTFSTFSWETLSLMRDGDYLPATLNIFLNIFLCIGAIILGMKLSKIVFQNFLF